MRYLFDKDQFVILDRENNKYIGIIITERYEELEQEIQELTYRANTYDILIKENKILADFAKNVLDEVDNSEFCSEGKYENIVIEKSDLDNIRQVLADALYLKNYKYNNGGM